jgi:hypothetical protein
VFDLGGEERPSQQLCLNSPPERGARHMSQAILDPDIIVF